MSKMSSVMMNKTMKSKFEGWTWAEKVRQMRARVSIMTPAQLVLQKHEQKPWGLMLSVTVKVEIRGW